MGGTWISQNKLIPDAYLNFKSVAEPDILIGNRGIGTMAIPLSWGPEGELIEVYSRELVDGSSLAKVGFTAFDEESKLLNLMLSNCYKALVYRLDSNGAKATATYENSSDEELNIEAAYSGTLGNNITITIDDMGDGLFMVKTWVSGAEKHRQTAADFSGLKANDFVTFSGSGALEENAGIVLSGGANGSLEGSTAYPEYLKLATNATWQTMALTQDTTAYASQFATFANQMWEDEGKYVQVVLSNYDAADSIAVINADCGAIVNGVEVTAEEATAWVAGITAGAQVNQSNVGREFSGATQILNQRTRSEIEEALQDGKFILSEQSGRICVVNDINSLRTITPDLSEDDKLNQVIRVKSEVGTTIQDTWNKSFKGLVQNNNRGRSAFRSAIISYLDSLENIEAIDEFAGADDVEVNAGIAKDAVISVLRIKPVSAMAKLYMNVEVR